MVSSGGRATAACVQGGPEHQAVVHAALRFQRGFSTG